MLNKEKYKDELEEILVIGEVFAFDKKRNEVCTCKNISCSICKFFVGEGCSENRKEWLNREYAEPEMDWSKAPIDTPILVRDCATNPWIKKHFAGVKDGKVCAWCEGRTSWSTNDEDEFCEWNYAKFAEDVEKPQDNAWHNLKDQKPEDRQEVLTWDGLGVHEDRWSDDADYFESTDAKEIWWREMPEPPEV